MSMMREKAVKDLAQYNTEMKELERVIAHEQRLKEFMTAKCSERSAQDEGQEMGRRQCRTLANIGDHATHIENNNNNCNSLPIKMANRKSVVIFIKLNLLILRSEAKL